MGPSSAIKFENNKYREIILLHLTKDNQTKNGNSSLSQTEQHTDHLIKADLHRRVDNRTLKRWFSSFSIGNALHVATIIGTPHTTLVSRVLLWLCSKSRTIKIRSQQKVYTKNECWCCCCCTALLLSKKDDRIISNWAESSGHISMT